MDDAVREGEWVPELQQDMPTMGGFPGSRGVIQSWPYDGCEDSVLGSGLENMFLNGGADDFSEGHDDLVRATLSTATNFKMMTEMKTLEEGPADTVRRVKAKPTELGADTVRR